MIGEIEVKPSFAGGTIPSGSIWTSQYVTLIVLKCTDLALKEYTTIQVREHRTDYVEYTFLGDRMSEWIRVV